MNPTRLVGCQAKIEYFIQLTVEIIRRYFIGMCAFELRRATFRRKNQTAFEHTANEIATETLSKWICHESSVREKNRQIWNISMW